MTTSPQPRAPRPSAIRRRPQPSPSLDEFIHAGTAGDTAHAEATPEVAVAVVEPAHHAHHRSGLIHFAIFIGLCALGVALFNVYHSLIEPIPPVSQVAPSAAPSATNMRPESVLPPATAPLPTTIPASVQTMSAVQGVQWLALTDLQFARHDLLLGMNATAMASLVLAKIHLNFLGKPFAPEVTELDRIIAGLQSAPILSLGDLDRDIEQLKGTWARITFGPSLGDGSLLGWLTPWRHPSAPDSRPELETTDAGRYLVARLDRLKWLALWGDEAGLRKASATLEDLLGEKFLKSPEAKPWLLWIRALQRTPLRHDVTEVNTLIVRLSRLELQP